MGVACIEAPRRSGMPLTREARLNEVSSAGGIPRFRCGGGKFGEVLSRRSGPFGPRRLPGEHAGVVRPVESWGCARWWAPAAEVTAGAMRRCVVEGCGRTRRYRVC